MKRYLKSYLTVAFALCASNVLGQFEASDEDTAIRNLIKHFYDGWNAHDAEMMVSIYDDSIDHINAFAEWRTGKQSLEEELIRFHAGPAKNSHKEITIEKVKFIKPDVAIAIVRQISAVGNVGMFVLSKGSGEWLVVSFANVPYELK